MNEKSVESPLISLLEIGAAIVQLNRSVESKLGLSVIQWCLLQTLKDMPGSSALSLATATGVHPSTLTQSLKRLQRKGYLFVGLNPKDSRRKVVSITRLGMKATDEAGKDILKFSKALSGVEKQLYQVRLFLQSQGDISS